MITTGLIKELNFISTCLASPISLLLMSPLVSFPIGIKVFNNILEVNYKEFLIWRETIESETSFFGIESCDAISRIIACIDNGSEWTQYRFIEKT